MRLKLAMFASAVSPASRPAFAAANPDFAVIRCVDFDEVSEDDELARSAVRAEPYTSFRARYFEGDGRGIAILAGAGLVLAHEQPPFGGAAVAQRILVQLPPERTVWLTNLHLREDGPSEPLEALIRWLIDVPPADASLICGLFDGAREGELRRRLESAGYRAVINTSFGAMAAETATCRLYVSGKVRIDRSAADVGASIITLEV